MSTVVEPSVARPARGRVRSALGAAALSAAVGLAGFGLGWRAKGGGPGGPAPQPHGVGRKSAPRVPVQVARLSQGGIRRTCSQIGSVQPFQEADLFAKASGYLAKLHVDYGDRVSAGQLLAEIDDPEVVEEEHRSEADLAQADSAVAKAEALVVSAQADHAAFATAVEQSEAEVARYASMRSFHEKKFARYRELVSSRAIPQQIADEEEEGYESAVASEVAAKKAVLNARAQLAAAAAKIKKAEADVLEARAAVQVARAKLAKARVLVSYTKIAAPYAGVVTRRNFFPGAFIRSAAEGGTVPLLTISRIDKVRVVTQVPDRYVPMTDVGDESEVKLDALPGQVFKGAVSRFADSEDPTSRTMHTEIDLPNPDGRLRPGMYGIASIILDRSEKAATLPAAALVGEARGGKGDVYIVKDGVARKARIEIGADDGLRIEVASGLDGTTPVILNAGAVTDGTPVEPTAAAQP